MKKNVPSLKKSKSPVLSPCRAGRGCRVIVLTVNLLSLLMFLAGCTEEPLVDPPQCPSDTTWNFVVIGDTRANPEIYRMNIETINRLSPVPALFFHTGDMVTMPDSSMEWEIHEEITGMLKSDIQKFFVVGNHDLSDVPDNMDLQHIVGRNQSFYYATRINNTLMILFNTETSDFELTAETLWLEEQLLLADADPDIDHIMIFMHHPVFPQGHHQGENLVNADELHQLFVEYGVELVFAGHEHQFFINEFDNVTYVITGGGGAPLHYENGGDFYHFVRVCCTDDHYRLQVISPEGRLLEEHDVQL